MLGRTTDVIKQKLPKAENFELLCELQHDLSGFDNLVQKDRRLIRQGCLLKHSKRGLQQRMFFLVSCAYDLEIPKPSLIITIMIIQIILFAFIIFSVFRRSAIRQ